MYPKPFEYYSPLQQMSLLYALVSYVWCLSQTTNDILWENFKLVLFHFSLFWDVAFNIEPLFFFFGFSFRLDMVFPISFFIMSEQPVFVLRIGASSKWHTWVDFLLLLTQCLVKKHVILFISTSSKGKSIFELYYSIYCWCRGEHEAVAQNVTIQWKGFLWNYF